MKRNLLTLSSELILVYVCCISIAGIIGIIVTNSLESEHITSTTDLLYATLETNELAALSSRMGQMQSTTTDSFTQFTKNIQFQHDYAYDVFTNEYSIAKNYTNYDTMDTNPSGTVDGVNEDVSFYYEQSTSGTSIYLNQSSLFDNSHGSMYKSTDLYAGLYMGFESDGLYRHYPYFDVSTTYPSLRIYCYHSGVYLYGYDPRCRLWYNLATNNTGDVVFTEPYFDATTNLAMITVARTVTINSNLLGVVAADLSIAPLSTFILSANVLESGYAYMCTSNSVLIIHPDIDYDSIYYINDIEFTSTVESTAFDTILSTFVFTGLSGQQKFTKNGQPW